jgi:hypothetical protein
VPPEVFRQCGAAGVNGCIAANRRTLGEVGLTGYISDISSGGCSFECADISDVSRAGLTVGKPMDLFFRFPHEETWRKLQVELPIFRLDDSKLVVGLKYQPDITDHSHQNSMVTIQTFIGALRI